MTSRNRISDAIFAWISSVVGGILIASLLCCGARTAPEVAARVLPQRVHPFCPATRFTSVGELVTVRVTPAPDSPDTLFSWASQEVEQPNTPLIQLTNQTRYSVELTSDHAADVVVRYILRRPGRRDEEANDLGSCTTRVIFQPDILLNCAVASNGIFGETIPLPVQVRSRTGRSLNTAWTVFSRPVGTGIISTSLPTPSNGTPSTLLLDARGVYTLDLTVRNDEGEVARCRINVSANAELTSSCPLPIRTPALQPFVLMPTEIRNVRDGQLTSGSWEFLPPLPASSTIDTSPVLERSARFFLDAAGDWTAIFRIGIVGTQVGSTCTVPITTFYDDDIHLELSWRRIGGSSPSGQHASLQLTQSTANNGVYPGQYQCVRSGCSCIEGAGMECAPNLVDWPPEGLVNDARKVYSSGCARPGPEHIAVRRAQPGTEFDVGVLFDNLCVAPLNTGREPMRAFVRVYCGGQLRYETEDQEIPYLISGPGERPDFGAWRIGRLRYNADGTCTMTRRCPDGQPQDACIGRTQEIYETP